MKLNNGLNNKEIQERQNTSTVSVLAIPLTNVKNLQLKECRKFSKSYIDQNSTVESLNNNTNFIRH